MEKRISQEEYSKKIGCTGEPIEDDDIMYQDDLVCILKPDVKKGIIVWTKYKQPAGMDSLSNIGLKTGVQLHSEGIYFGRTKIHPYIFFRAPFYSNPIDYTSVKTEIESSYGELGTEPRIFIRVDPDKTFVFSSEIRVNFTDYEEQNSYLNKSKKLLSEYLEIIKDNLLIESNIIPHDKKLLYNLITSKAKLFLKIAYPGKTFNEAPTNRNSEILVSIPHLTPKYFVTL